MTLSLQQSLFEVISLAVGYLSFLYGRLLQRKQELKENKIQPSIIFLYLYLVYSLISPAVGSQRNFLMNRWKELMVYSSSISTAAHPDIIPIAKRLSTKER